MCAIDRHLNAPFSCWLKDPKQSLSKLLLFIVQFNLRKTFFSSLSLPGNLPNVKCFFSSSSGYVEVIVLYLTWMKLLHTVHGVTSKNTRCLFRLQLLEALTRMRGERERSEKILFFIKKGFELPTLCPYFKSVAYIEKMRTHPSNVPYFSFLILIFVSLQVTTTYLHDIQRRWYSLLHILLHE